jgi:hypothetical protein
MRRRAAYIAPARMGGMLDAVTTALGGHLGRATDASLLRSMHYPTTWDPSFSSTMTLGEPYRYPTRHFWHHRRQLTLPGRPLTAAAGRVPRSSRRVFRELAWAHADAGGMPVTALLDSTRPTARDVNPRRVRPA